MVPVSARVTELRLNANNVDCVLEKSDNYPSNWREGLDDIPDPVLAQFKKLVPRKQLPSADYVILCTGLRADFRCYCVDPKGVDASNSIQQQAAIAQTLKLVGATGTAAQAFVDNSAVTKEMVPTFKERKQEVCVRIFFSFFLFFFIGFFFFFFSRFPFLSFSSNSSFILHLSSFVFFMQVRQDANSRQVSKGVDDHCVRHEKGSQDPRWPTHRRKHATRYLLRRSERWKLLH